MQNIIIILLLLLGTAYADTVGVPEKSWVDAPAVPTKSETVNQLQIGEEYVVPKDRIITSTPLGETINETKPFFTLNGGEKYGKMLIDFVNPLLFFVEKNMALFGTFLALMSLFFYIFFYRPLLKRVHQSDDEDIIIPHALRRKDGIKSSLAPEGAIISRRQYETLYGLINETFIYEKESVLLDKSLPQEQRNRDVISLEWKFNQILHFSLPKLSTNDPQQFKEGVKELLAEALTRDILIAALEDIVQEDTLKEADKASIQKMLEAFENKAVNNLKPQATNYSALL